MAPVAVMNTALIKLSGNRKDATTVVSPSIAHGRSTFLFTLRKGGGGGCKLFFFFFSI